MDKETKKTCNPSCFSVFEEYNNKGCFTEKEGKFQIKEMDLLSFICVSANNTTPSIRSKSPGKNLLKTSFIKTILKISLRERLPSTFLQ